MRRAIAIALVVAFASLLALPGLAVAQDGEPTLPHQFYGTVKIRTTETGTNVNAPVGTVVSAKVDGVEKGRITVNTPGKYGGPTLAEGKLLVSDVAGQGNPIEFYINDECLADIPPGGWPGFDSGAIDELNLTAYCPVPPPPPPPPRPPAGPGGAPPVGPPEIEVIVDEESVFYDISDEGELLEDVWRVCEGCGLTLGIPEGTICLDEDGNPLDIVELTPDETPLCPPPENGYIIGTPCNFEPDGASFDPPCEVIVSYDEADIHEDVAEEELVYGYCDETTLEWVVLEDFEVDTVNNTVTARVPEFTTFAILGFVIPPPPAAFSVSDLSIQPAEVEVAETVTITVSVANTGGREGSYSVVLKINGVKEAEDSVTLAPGRSQDVTFTVTKEEAGSYSVDVNGLTGSFTVKPAPLPPPEAPPVPPPAPPVAPPPGINWAILGPIIAVAVFLAIFLPIKRRRRAG